MTEREALEKIRQIIAENEPLDLGDVDQIKGGKWLECWQVADKALNSSVAWNAPDENTPDDAAVWRLTPTPEWSLERWSYVKWVNNLYEKGTTRKRPVVLAKENKGPPKPGDVLPEVKE
jgi:hypothetical protein